MYEDDDSRQYVVGPDGERVDGVWLLPPDEPLLHPTTPAPGSAGGRLV